MSKIRLVQISDPHVVVPEKQPVPGHNTAERLRAAVEAVNGLCPRPDFVILTGDLTNDEEEGSYLLVKSILTQLQAPLYLAVGNHDARLLFRRIMMGEVNPQPDPIHYTFHRNGYRFIILDSLEEGKITGSVDETQLSWLDDTLSDSSERFTIVCLHHPPVPTGVWWMDSMMLQQPDRLLRVLGRHPSVRWVLCGHVHHAFFIRRGRITYLTAPSVSFQFRQDPLPPPAENPARLLSAEPPGFRIVDFSHGVLNTSLRSIPSSPW